TNVNEWQLANVLENLRLIGALCLIITLYDGVVGFGNRWNLAGNFTTFSDPFITTTIHQANVLMAIQCENPESICCPPVRLVPVEDDRGVATNPFGRRHLGKAFWINKIAGYRIVEFSMPVDFYSTGDMSGRIQQGIFIGLKDNNIRIAFMLLDPLG